MQCAKDKNRCAQEDDFMPVYEAMAAADGLLVGSPVYFGSATPNMMALLDRAGYVARQGDNPFYRKVGSPVVVARRAGVNFTYAQLQFWFVIMGMFTPGATYWPIAYGLKPGDAGNDAEGMKTMQNLARKYGLADEEDRVGEGDNCWGRGPGGSALSLFPKPPPHNPLYLSKTLPLLLIIEFF